MQLAAKTLLYEEKTRPPCLAHLLFCLFCLLTPGFSQEDESRAPEQPAAQEDAAGPVPDFSGEQPVFTNKKPAKNPLPRGYISSREEGVALGIPVVVDASRLTFDEQGRALLTPKLRVKGDQFIDLSKELFTGFATTKGKNWFAQVTYKDGILNGPVIVEVNGKIISQFEYVNGQRVLPK